MRRSVWLAVLVSLLGVAAVLAWRSRVPEEAGLPPVAAHPPSAPRPEPESPPDPIYAPPGDPPGPPLVEPEAPPTPWAKVDLEAVREALPDNLYWELAAPTSDPRLLGDRERDKAFRNEQYGKILSGTGTEAEIQDYYEHRQRVSSDYVRFVDYLLDHYGDDLEERDLELLHVARRLHMARLREIPKRMQEAFDRKREQDAAREAWLADEKAFDSAQAGDPSEPPADSDAEPEPGLP
jgi:hypothetical protein